MGAKCRHGHRHQDAKVRYSLEASVHCEQSTATRSSAAGSLPLRKPAAGTSPPARLLRSRSSVRLRRGYTCLLFLHTSAGKNPAGSVPGRQEAAVPAAGADLVSLVHSFAVPPTAKDCAGGSVPGLTATGVLPSIQHWAVPAQAPEAVCLPHKLPVFVGVWEPEVSQPLRRQSPPTPSRQTASPASLRFAPAPWWFRDSKAGTRIPDRIKSNDSARATVQPLRLQTTKAYKLTYASAAVPHRATSPARKGGKR